MEMASNPKESMGLKKPAQVTAMKKLISMGPSQRIVKITGQNNNQKIATKPIDRPGGAQLIEFNNEEDKNKITPKNSIIYSKVPGKEKYIGLKITNLNDLRKATPRLKLPGIYTSGSNRISSIPEDIKQHLLKYCRTCAGLKVPLVDIFSERGTQMRLSQQIQHLEEIYENESLSTQMCMDCICDMKMSYKFFMQIKKAEMKLQSIYNSLNSKTEAKSNSILDGESKTDLIHPSEIKKEINNQDFYGLNDTFSDGQESYEEFDPDNALNIKNNENSHTASVTTENKDTKHVGKSENKLDELSSDLINLGSTEIENNGHLEIQSDSNTDGVASLEVSNQTSKLPNILKRKRSNENVSGDSAKICTKKDVRSLFMKDLKIPKLNLEDAANIKKEENGVMYVTAKGSKPNEMLLIKVKKIDKSTEVKADKAPVKKKADASAIRKIFCDPENDTAKVINEQIKEYAKKKAKFLGHTDLSGIILDKEDTDKTINLEPSTITETFEQIEEMSLEEDNISMIFDKNLPSLIPEEKARLEKLTQRYKDIKKTHDVTNSDLTEDCIDRLKNVLKQKDEYLFDFVNYLKHRRIVVSRLRDIDIISLYEKKNNVVLEKSLDGETVEEDIFNDCENYSCDFCFKSFQFKELEYEHTKIHDFKLMHYCEDCKTEFLTHKAKRSHSISCVQKLMCKYCDMILESKGKKRQHEQKHCDDKYGQLCDRCGEKFKHIGTLDQHVKAKHMHLEKIYKCPQCPKRFAFRTKLTFHLKSVHTSSRAYLCEDCGSDFKNPASLRHHRIRKHQLVGHKKECQVCHKMIPIYSMSKHKHTHKTYDMNCPHCDKKFKNTSTLKQHLKIHEDQRQYKCDTCGVGFNRRDGLKLHMRVHQKSDSRGLKECSCQVCGEKFPNHSMLVIHRNRTHKDGKVYTCHICNRSMISVRSLQWHLSHIHDETIPENMKSESAEDPETQRVICEHCNKTFKTEMILRTHIKNTHTEKDPIKCLDCEQLFTSEVRWKHHMMVEHNRLEGTFKCPHCPKRFVNHLRLKTHMISHSDRRPHSCDICGFMLKTKVQLIKHKQNRHSDERPLQCKYCDWRCKQVSALVCHERTHTNERPYACSVCKQRFKYLGDKNKHERRHESLGGSGFKRIVTQRNSSGSKGLKRERQPMTELESDAEEMELGEDEIVEDSEEIELSEEHFIKMENSEIIPGVEDSFEQYVDRESSTGNTGVVIGMQETTVYTEEVTADQIGSTEIITGELDEQVLQPGTVVHIQQEDEDGKIQMIPVMLSLPDLSDATTEVNLATASIMYSS